MNQALPMICLTHHAGAGQKKCVDMEDREIT